MFQFQRINIEIDQQLTWPVSVFIGRWKLELSGFNCLSNIFGHVSVIGN